MKINYQKIKNANWYRQGAAAKPLYVSYPITACQNFYLKNKPLDYYYRFIADIRQEQMVDYIDKKCLVRNANFYLHHQIKTYGFIEQIKKHWQEHNVNKFLLAVEELARINFTQFSDQQLLKKFLDFSKTFMGVWYNSIFHDTFDVEGEKILFKILKQAKLNLNGQELEILLTYPQPSILQQERLDLFKIVHATVKNKIALNKLTPNYLKNSFFQIHAMLIRHVAKYHWLYNDFASIVKLDEKYFLKNIKGIISSQEKLAEEEALKNSFKKLKVKREKLIKDKKVSRPVMNIISMLATIARWRDERKAYNQLGDSIVEKFIKEFSLRIGVKQNILEHLLWQELEKIFYLSKNDLRQLDQRMRQGILSVVFRQGKIRWLPYIQAEKIRKIMIGIMSKCDNLKGRPAYPGKVQARARIILNKKDFHKLKPGEILVAPNTRPEYVPIMKIAGAIISEEGGITCHAAIISRELKKPAVVGVQGALDVLKDGDLVEVDADQGIVRKLK